MPAPSFLRRTAVLAMTGLAAPTSACAPSPEEVAAQQASIAALAASALDRCDRSGGINNDDAAYTARLTRALQRIPASTLQTFDREGVAVCLDQRLTTQKLGSFEGEVHSVYYSRERVVGIPDNGSLEVGSIFNPGNPALSISGDLQSALAERLNSPTAVGENLYGYSYFCCGKGGVWRHTWDVAAEFNERTLRSISWGQQAPVAPRIAAETTAGMAR